MMLNLSGGKLWNGWLYQWSEIITDWILMTGSKHRLPLSAKNGFRHDFFGLVNHVNLHDQPLETMILP